MSRPGTAASKMDGKETPEMPDISNDDPFPDLLRELSLYIERAVREPRTFEELTGSKQIRALEDLVDYLTDEVHHRCLVNALMVLVGEFKALESEDARGVNMARASACEYIAWRFTSNLSEREAIDYLLYELPSSRSKKRGSTDLENGSSDLHRNTSNAKRNDRSVGEDTPLLNSSGGAIGAPGDMLPSMGSEGPMLDKSSDEELLSYFENMNALEIATVREAKKFLSQRVVQRMIEAIWRGDVVFWETLDVDSEKQAKPYNKWKADPFCRLRVPRYLKAFEAVFFISFLILYYAVLIPVQRGSRDERRDNPPPPGVPPSPPSFAAFAEDEGEASKHFHSVMPAEILLYIWIISFAYDEFGDYLDAGSAFYRTNFWSLWDVCIVALSLVFFVLRVVGLVKHSDDIISIAFDLLALEALLLLPRACSLLSLNPYFGTLIPCLRAMTKDFFKFMTLVVILYLGFLTTFTLLARDNFTLREMSWVQVKIFFGSAPLGFDIAGKISPILGAPLMLIFITMTNLLLMTTLISLLSNSLIRILDHAREEYLYIYSVYVLEASTSNRLTYYLPPFNLIPLLLRPLRLIVGAETLRKIRIVLLKISHLPCVAAIWAYEGLNDYFSSKHHKRPGALSSSLAGPSSMSSSTTKRLSYMYGSRNDTRKSANGSKASSTKPDKPGTSGLEALDDVKELLAKLSDRVDELSKIVADQENSS